MAEAVSKRGLSNPITDEQMLSAIVGQLVVDNGFSLSDMVNVVTTYHGVSIYGSPQLTIPVQVDQFGNYYYKGSNYGDIEFPIQPQDQQTTDQFLGVSPTTDTMNGSPLPSPASVTVSVLDGSGAYDQASTTAEALGQLGFDMVGTGDTPSVGSPSETLVTYSQLTPTDEAAAQAVADSMSGAVTLDFGPTTDGADVTVTTGSDFAVDAPAATTTPSTGSPTTSGPTNSTPDTIAPTTTSTTLAGSGDFSAPTSDVEPLAAWDPRSCTPTGGEGP